MVTTTVLSESEQNQPLSNPGVQYMLDVARKVTGRNYQVHEIFHYRRRWWQLKPRRVRTYVGLLVHVGGILDWQLITSARNDDAIIAYLDGVCSGYDLGAKKEK